MAPVSTRAWARRRGRAGFFLGALCLWGTGVLACGPSAGGSTREQVGQLGLALSGAQIERGYSGTLALITVTREQVGLCTGTLLAPNLVATARHCIAPTSADVVRCSEDPASFSPPYSSDSLWVNHSRTLSGPLASFGLLPFTGGSDEFVPVSEVFVPDTNDVCGGDLALLLLSTKLDADVAAPLTPRLDEPVERGDSYTAVGFGDTLEEGGQGTRRSRTGLEVNCAPEDCELGAIEPTEFQGGEGVCSGDSGGPALDAEGRVVGIASRSEDCTRSVYSAVFGWRAFIREVAARAARAGGYPAPEWLVEAPPEPEPPEPEPVAIAPAAASAPPEPTPTPAEQDPSGDASDAARRPPAASEASGGSGCTVAGSSIARRPPALALLSFCLGLLALCGRRLRVRQ